MSSHLLPVNMGTLSRVGTKFGIYLLTLSCYAWAQATNNTDLGTSAVGQSTAATATFSSVSGTPTTYSLVYGTDFTVNTQGCTNTAPFSCPVTFTPHSPGLRRDALVAKDSSGNVIGTQYLHGMGQGALGMMTPGLIHTLDLGSLSSATVKGATFDPAGNLFLSDGANARIIKVTPNGAATVFGVSLPQGYPTGFYPHGLAVDGAGVLYVVDSSNSQVLQVAPSGTATVLTFTGLTAPAGLNTPTALVLDADNNLYVADKENDRVIKRAPDGTATVLNLNTTSNPPLDGPIGLALDHMSGTLYINSSNDPPAPSTIIKVLANGTASNLMLSNNVSLQVPASLAADAAGNLYIADTGGNQLLRARPDGTALVIAGSGAAGNTGDNGPATSAQIATPFAVAVSPDGKVYLSDTTNNVIRQISNNNTAVFAATAVGSNSQQTVTFANLGNASATLASPLSFGNNSTPFSLGNSGTTDCASRAGTSFAAGANCTLQVQFAPTVAGPASASLTPFAGATLTFQGTTAPTTQVTLASDTPGASFAVSGSGCAPGAYTAQQNTLAWVVNATCSVTATAPSGYLFSAWTDNNSTTNPRTFTAPASAVTYTAHFSATSSPCSYALSAASASFSASASDGSVNVTAPTGCAWTAISNASWLTVTAGAQGSAGGTVSFHLDVNSGSSSRTGAITVGGQTMTVVQGAATVASGALRFVPVAPCRVADTRNDNGPFGGPLLTGQTTRDFAIPQSTCNIPANAQAYSLNFTVVPVDKLTYLTVFPTGQPQPVASTLNSLDGRIKANAAMMPAGANGAVSVFATDDTQLVIDINGYFVPASTPSALAFYPMTPCRMVDTRGPVGPLGAPALSAQQERVFPVLTSACPVPATAQAYALNYTVAPKGALSFLTTWPTGQTRPGVSTLNAPTGAITANAALVPAGDLGNLSVFATNETDLIIDINGYFAPPGSGGLSLYNIAPCRVYDSRAQTEAQPIIQTVSINVAGSNCSAPAGAQAYIFNATVVPTQSLTFLTLWQHGAGDQPNASTLNALDGAVMSNLAIVPTTDGSVNVFASHSTHLILDIFSYFAQ